MTGQRRIGLFTPGWPGNDTPNGIATSVYFLAMGLREIGAKPVILASRLDGPGPAGIPVIQIRDVRWRWWDRLRARFGDPALEGHRMIARSIAAAVRDASETYGLDAVLMEETNGWAGMVQDLVPVPVVVVLHGPWVLHKTLQSNPDVGEDQRREARENHAFAAATALIAPSRNVLEAVEAVVPLADKPRIVLPNTLSIDSAAPLSAERAPLDILFVGRFDPHKGGDIMLEAFTRLTETHPRARLTFAGVDYGIRQPDGAIMRLEELLPALPENVRSRLIYKGRVDRTGVARLREQHAIALIASRYENLNYTLLEAMGAGQAIVSTNVGGPAEVLENGETALLVPPDDPGAMADALGRLLDDPSLVRRLGGNGRNMLRQDFDPSVVAEQTMRFIEGILDNTSG